VMPERLLGAGVICGAPPLREVGTDGLFWGYKIAMLAQRFLPFTVRPGLRVGAWIADRDFDQWPQTWMARFYAAEDRRALTNPRLHRIMMESSRIAVLSHSRAVRWDGNIYSSNWGFNLADLKPPIHFWHGGEDWNIPLGLAQKTAARIPNARFKIYPRDGHFSLPLLHNEEMIGEMLQTEAVKC